MNFYEAQLQVRRICEETGMSIADVAALPLDEFARLTRGETPAQAAIAAYNREQDTKEQAQPPAPSAREAPAGASQGVDIASMDWATYAQFRREAGIGGREYGNGILGAHGSWADAARAKAGRSAMAGNRNTVEAPRIERAFISHDEHLDQRSASARFSNQANMWQGR